MACYDKTEAVKCKLVPYQRTIPVIDELQMKADRRKSTIIILLFFGVTKIECSASSN
jgi:hypothetical protein